jgi:long-chain acyl-CoA synthetase
MQRFLLNEFQASTVKRYIFSKSLHISEVFHKFKDTGFHWTVPRKWRLAYVLAQTWVFSKLHRKLGGKLRLMVSDGSLSPKLSRFFVQIGLPVIETYSLPECSSAILTNRLLDPRPSALKPLPGVELRLLPDGELLVKSPSVMLGYHKQAEETQKTIVNGWLYTGEFAEIDDRGHIVVTGRKKNAIHLSDGTFVAARFVESTLTTSPYIHQAVLIGNGRPYITALIVPDTAACEAYLHESGIEAEASEWSRLPELKRLIQTEIDRLIQNFSPYAKPQKFTVLPEAFSVQKGELTSTLKLRLPRIEENHASMIEAMYQDTPLAKTDSSIEF